MDLKKKLYRHKTSYEMEIYRIYIVGAIKEGWIEKNEHLMGKFVANSPAI